MTPVLTSVIHMMILKLQKLYSFQFNYIWRELFLIENTAVCNNLQTILETKVSLVGDNLTHDKLPIKSCRTTAASEFSPDDIVLQWILTHMKYYQHLTMHKSALTFHCEKQNHH